MNLSSKNIIVLVLIVLIIVVFIMLCKIISTKERFSDDSYSMKKTLELVKNAVDIQKEGGKSNIAKTNSDITHKLDLIESYIQKLKKIDAVSKVSEIEEAKRKEYLVLKCSPNSSKDIVQFENAPEIKSTADSNREILQNIVNELESLN